MGEEATPTEAAAEPGPVDPYPLGCIMGPWIEGQSLPPILDARGTPLARGKGERDRAEAGRAAASTQEGDLVRVKIGNAPAGKSREWLAHTLGGAWECPITAPHYSSRAGWGSPACYATVPLGALLGEVPRAAAEGRAGQVVLDGHIVTWAPAGPGGRSTWYTGGGAGRQTWMPLWPRPRFPTLRTQRQTRAHGRRTCCSTQPY